MKKYILTSTNENFTKFQQIEKDNEIPNQRTIINKYLIINRIEESKAEYYIHNTNTERLNKVSVNNGDLKCGSNGDIISELPKIK
jgi:hypothetical protein